MKQLYIILCLEVYLFSRLSHQTQARITKWFISSLRQGVNNIEIQSHLLSIFLWKWKIQNNKKVLDKNEVKIATMRKHIIIKYTKWTELNTEVDELNVW